MTALYLSERSLKGTLPTTVGTLGSMTGLYLENNLLVGLLPSELGLLTDLQELYLYSNRLNSSLPTELGLLTGLHGFDLSSNSFSRAAPSSFCSLRPNISLQLQSNPGLTCLPSCLSNPPYTSLNKDSALPDCTFLDGMALCNIYNQQSAAVKLNAMGNWNCTVARPCGSSWWNGVTCQGDRVTALWLPGRSLEGTLPTTVGNLGSMTGLNLQNNLLEGLLPSELGLLTGLQELALSENHFNSSLPTELVLLTGLQQLYLSNNFLEGPLPYELGLMTGLQVLSLYNNSFSGAVPSSFCSFGTSISLRLQNNPGLTCLPSCLTNPPYTSLNKDSNLTALCTVSATISCSPYSLSDTNSAQHNYAKCSFTACGGSQVTISSCARFSGDTYLWLVDAAGSVIASNDNSGGACRLGSTISLSISGACQVYTIREGCYKSGSCNATVTITRAYIGPNNAPTPQPSQPIGLGTARPTGQPTRQPTRQPT